MHTQPRVEPPAQSLGKVGQLQSGSTSQMSAEQAGLEQAHPFLGRDSGPCLRLGNAGEHTRVHTRAHAHMHAHTHRYVRTQPPLCFYFIFPPELFLAAPTGPLSLGPRHLPQPREGGQCVS